MLTIPADDIFRTTPLFTSATNKLPPGPKAKPIESFVPVTKVETLPAAVILYTEPSPFDAYRLPLASKASASNSVPGKPLTNVDPLPAAVNRSIVSEPEFATYIVANRVVCLLAGLMSVVGFVAFLIAAKVLPLGPTTALRETSVIFGALIGTLVLKEGFGLRRIVAATLVVAGIAVLASLH